MVRQAAVPFEQTTAYVLWLASDHMHLYIDATPDYSLDEIVHALGDGQPARLELGGRLPGVTDANATRA
jgi:hypothetical protein